MSAIDFTQTRKTLQKTQKQMAELLGKSLKAIHSYEQGRRKVPPLVAIHLLFLLHQRHGSLLHQKPCWVIKKCPPPLKKKCPAWEFQAGTLCMLISGTQCEGKHQTRWKDKIKICKKCEVLQSFPDAQTSDTSLA